MAQKRIDNKANGFSLTEDFIAASGQAVPQRETIKEKSVRSRKPPVSVATQRTEKGAARGCKPGYTRHTYVLPQQMIDQVKAVAHFFNCSEVAAAEQILQKGLDDIQKKHGKKALTLQKTQSLFD